MVRLLTVRLVPLWWWGSRPERHRAWSKEYLEPEKFGLSLTDVMLPEVFLYYIVQ